MQLAIKFNPVRGDVQMLSMIESSIGVKGRSAWT